MNRFSAILFDLDGTLVDTAPDLAYALNCVLEENGRDKLSYETIRPVASHGSVAMLKLAFDITPDDEHFKSLQQRFLDIYQNNITLHSTLFDGMEQVLTTLAEKNITWGVVTNKPAFLTEPLLTQLGLIEQAACVVSADTTPYSKPHPAPMLHACETIQLAPEDCIYIGDAARDIEAGKNVSMPTVLARYGYLSDDDKQQDWQADAVIDHPTEILKWI
jgi:phosphoglycolate phosphatase